MRRRWCDTGFASPHRLFGQYSRKGLIMPRNFNISLPSQLGNEKIAMAAVIEAARHIGLTPHRLDDLKTALTEAITNAIEHGNQHNRRLKVRIKFQQRGNTLILSVIDRGLCCLPPLSPVRQERADHRGLGLFLIQQLTDEVKIITRPGHNELKMMVYC